MHILIEGWRAIAANRHARANELGPCRAGEVLAAEAGTLRQCADQLEQVWHEDWHNASWSPELCAICLREMEEERRHGNPS